MCNLREFAQLVSLLVSWLFLLKGSLLWLIAGDICPQGSYCPQGSPSPLLCPAGYYLNGTGSDDLGDCVTCTAGQYCDGSANVLPDGPCSPGYYCPGGQDSPTTVGLNCTQGHHCPEGSVSPVRCASGSYQDEFGQAECKACPAGYFCDNVIDPVVLYNNSACPVGFYCPENTTTSNQYPCPPGESLIVQKTAAASTLVHLASV